MKMLTALLTISAITIIGGSINRIEMLRFQDGPESLFRVQTHPDWRLVWGDGVCTLRISDDGETLVTEGDIEAAVRITRDLLEKYRHRTLDDLRALVQEHGHPSGTLYGTINLYGVETTGQGSLFLSLPPNIIYPSGGRADQDEK